ncbi:MAG TPA: glycosyltransferase [Candidatus Binataceae bacterium]|nr:glycosyltransferase [Candidatus Binataceae bacterium]
MAIRLTLAVPTHNRAATLGETLASLAAQSLPAGVETECLVIDNNSSDRTPAVVEEAAARAPFAVRRVFEASPGSSFARNRAIDEAAGDFILFIDDDAVADSNWAALLLAAIERRGLDAACGMVLPRWEVAPPRWLGPSLYVRFAVHDQEAIVAAPLRDAEVLRNYFSANVGFRRTCFTRFGRFREDLGVVGGNPISGEDTELFARIIANGGAMGFVTEARVFHLVPAARMNRKYLLRKAFAFGVGTAQAGGRSHNHFDKLVRNAIRMAAAAARGDRERALCHELECANFFGYWWGRLPKRGAPPPNR